MLTFGASGFAFAPGYVVVGQSTELLFDGA
jgi:hypothetical protein